MGKVGVGLMRTQITSPAAYYGHEFESPLLQTGISTRNQGQLAVDVKVAPESRTYDKDFGACLVFLGGTGVTSRLRTLTVEGGINSQLACLFGFIEQPHADEVRLSIPASLSNIRGTFGLSVRDLAAVLRTSRPTLYSWLDGQVVPRPAALDRIHMIGRFAKYWNLISKQPAGGFMHQPLQGGDSFLALMSRDRLQQEHIETALRTLRDFLAAQTAERAPTLAEKLRRTGAVQLSKREYRQVHQVASPTNFTDDQDRE
ncbi:MAG: hypothetical protein ACYDC8_15950 [Gammaproteobacteria bacterium]